MIQPRHCGKVKPKRASVMIPRISGRLPHGIVDANTKPGKCRGSGRLLRQPQAFFGGGHHAAAEKVAEAAKQAAAAAKVEAILKMPLWQHSSRCLLVVGVLLWGSAYLSHLLHREADRVEAGEEAAWLVGADQPKKEQSLARVALKASIHSVERPLATFLPVLAWMQAIKAIAMLLDVCAIHGQKNTLPKFLTAVVNNTHLAMRTIHLALVGASEVAVIIFAVWVMIRMKERLVKLFVESEQRYSGEKTVHQKNQDRALERIVVPLSGLASWMAVLSGALMSLHVLGINIQPLLTVGGVSGVIVGLSAQSVVSNMISGVNLFLSRPFVVGERIDISHSSGAKFMTGYVERVDPMRTILRTDTCMPVMIPNKVSLLHDEPVQTTPRQKKDLPNKIFGSQVLADMIISNESRINKSYVVSNFRKPRQYVASISVRHSDMHAVEKIVSQMKAWLDASPGIEKSLPCFVGLASLDNQACNLTVLMHTTAPTSREFGTFRQKLLLDFGEIVRKNDAKLAMPTQIIHVSGHDTEEILVGNNAQNGASNGNSNGNKQQNPPYEEIVTA